MTIIIRSLARDRNRTYEKLRNACERNDGTHDGSCLGRARNLHFIISTRNAVRYTTGATKVHAFPAIHFTLAASIKMPDVGGGGDPL